MPYDPGINMADENDDLPEDLDELTGSKGNGKDEEEIYIKVIDEEDPYSDTVDDDTSVVVADPPDTAQIAELEKQLFELRREKDDIHDRLLRKHADFENFRKRTEKDKREYQSYALSDFMFELLAILDNFERALSHADDQPSSDYQKGIELIYRQLKDVLEKKGLRAIDSVGKNFDPNFHEAITREEKEDVPENTILEEFQKGYFFREKLLRPAMVKVSYKPAGAGKKDVAQEDAPYDEE
jgi:molecular chaperone GrpE